MTSKSLILWSVLALIQSAGPAAVQVRAQGENEIQGGFRLSIQEYRDAKRRLDEALDEAPAPVVSPVTPKEIGDLMAKQNDIGEKLRASPEDKELQDQFGATVTQKYGKLRQALNAEVSNAARNIEHDRRVIPLLEEFVRRGQQFRKMATDQNLSPEQREQYKAQYKEHLGTYARYQARIRERRNDDAQRLKLALVNARGGFDRLVLPDDDLLRVIEQHTDYADALRSEYVNDLKGWLSIAGHLQVLIDNFEVRELVENLTGRGMSSVTAVSQKLSERRTDAIKKIQAIFTMFAGPIDANIDGTDVYGEDSVEEMTRW